MLKNPSSLTKIERFKTLINPRGKTAVFTLIFFGAYGNDKSFSSYSNYAGASSSIALTIRHVTLYMGMAGSGFSVGMGLSTAAYGFNYGASYSRFNSFFTEKGRRIGKDILNTIKSNGMKNARLPKTYKRGKKNAKKHRHR